MLVRTDVVELNQAESTQLTETACGPEQVEEHGATSKGAGVGASTWSSSAVTGDGGDDSVKTGLGLHK